MLRLPSYLLKRADRYYFRIVIPEALRPYWPGREIKHSLSTSDRARAVRASRALSVYLEGLFEAVAMGGLTNREAKRLLEVYLKTELAAQTRRLDVRGPFNSDEKQRLTATLARLRNFVSSLHSHPMNLYFIFNLLKFFVARN